MSRLIIISNRLPFAIDKLGDDIVVRQSSGGLVSAIKSYFESLGPNDQQFSEKVWLGSLDATEDDWSLVTDMHALQADFGIEPVFIDKETYTSFYNGFSNSTLWPLFHYFPSVTEYKKESFEAYEKVNEAFADKVAKIYKEGDVIWVHDYQLMLLPNMIRERVPDAAIGFFLHIPFPSYEIFRLMPGYCKKGLLQGILGADLIGFHTHDYVQHFIQSCKMVLQVENQFSNIYYKDRVIRVDQFPIGIDYNKFRNAAEEDTVITIREKLQETFAGQKIIFSVDRLDYTKGLNYRLDGYEMFLEQHPEWKEKVVFVLNIIPSRDLIPAYIERKKAIEEKVSTINGKMSTLHWQPLIYRYNHLDFSDLCALYQVADVALITPLRDGMNLVAKEYVASCIDKGVLVLSELTGAANELSEALLVNPTDTEELAAAINTALVMPEQEQQSRLEYMQKRLREYDVVKWVNDFLDQLQQAKVVQDKNKVHYLDNASIFKMTEDFANAERRCILLDYDGTLTPLQKLPSMALPSNELLDLLAALTEDEKNEIVIISGRDADTLESWMGKLNVTLVAEHGAMVRHKDHKWQLQSSLSNEWKEQIRPILQLFVTRCAGSFIEEKKNTLAWHYRNTYADLGFVRSRELRNTLLQITANMPLQIIDGNKVLEVRVMGVDKGNTAQNILNYFNPDFAMCLGDDTTDEDMFRVMREKAYTIKIGSGTTSAQFSLRSQKDVFPLLRKFISPIRKQEYGYSQV